MQSMDRILGAGFGRAPSGDVTRAELWKSATLDAQAKQDTDDREAVAESKKSPVPTVKISGRDGQIPDYTGLAAVSEVFWPDSLTQPREPKAGGSKYQHVLEILQQATIFNRWTPRLQC